MKLCGETVQIVYFRFLLAAWSWCDTTINHQPSMQRNFSFVVFKYRLVDQHLKMSRIWKISHLWNTGVSAGPGTPLPTGRSTAGPCLIYVAGKAALYTGRHRHRHTVAGKAALYREHCSSRPQPSNERWAATLGESHSASWWSNLSRKDKFL